MSVPTLLKARLAAQVAAVSGRVYPNKFPQGVTVPAIRYTLITTERPEAMGSSTGVKRSRYQIDAIADTYTEAEALEASIESALGRWRDTGNGVQDTFILTSRDDWDDDTHFHRRIVDIEINTEGV